MRPSSGPSLPAQAASQRQVRPPTPPFASDRVGGLQVLAGLHRNGYGAFPARCLNEPVVRMRLPGRALFVVSDGEAMIEMLQTRGDDFARTATGRRVMGPLVGRGLLTSDGEHWRRQRKAMAPAFTPRALPMMAAHVVRVAEPAVARLEAMGDAPVDLLAAMQALSLQIASVSMFSVESAAFQTELRQRVGRYMAGVGRPAAEDFLLPEFVPTPLMLRRRAFRRRWLRLMREVVAKRSAAGPRTDARDLFDLLSQVHAEDAAELLIDEVATMLIAGHETTALTLFWSLYLLAQCPDWRDAVAAETAPLDLSPDCAMAALPRLPKTRAVVNETLRLFSPAFITARVAVRATAVAGHAVPKGSFMLAPFWIVHRNPKHWPDPGLFDPGRFLSGAEPGRSCFLPFGAGPRVCIGAQLAMTEAVLVLALVLRRRAPLLVDPTRPALPVATLSTRPDHAPTFRLAAR